MATPFPSTVVTSPLFEKIAAHPCPPPIRRYRERMDNETDKGRGLAQWLLARLHIFMAIAGLIAWLVMLWLMFGDVL